MEDRTHHPLRAVIIGAGHVGSTCAYSLQLSGLVSEIAAQTLGAAYEIIKRKGATYYAIATGLVRIIEVIVRNENSVLTVSSIVEGPYSLSDVSLSLPSIVNRNGIAHVLELPLITEERAALEKSAQTIRGAIESIEGVYA